MPAPADRVWETISDLSRWPEIFSGWLASVTPDDDRFGATGTNNERYDLYPHPAEDRRAVDVEVVDELGSSDVLRIRLIDTRGGCFIVAVAAKLVGVSDDDWQRVSGAIGDGVAAIGELL